MSNKKKLDAYRIANLSESCSAIIQRKLPEKQSDPGNFIIPCVIGEHNFKKALCGLGASINLMSLSVVKKLNLGELTPTTLSLQMADFSVTYPQSILKDVLMKVDNFIFIMLEMEEDKEVPIILGRSFLATGQAVINVKNGELTFDSCHSRVIWNQQNLYPKFLLLP